MSQLELLYGQVLANVIAVIIVVLCWRWRVAGRLSLVVLFLWAGQYNLRTAFLHPEQYLAYAQLAYFTRYQQFILGLFARHTTAVVATIAVGQLAVAVLIALRGRAVYLGPVGAIVFLVAIAPLGIWRSISSYDNRGLWSHTPARANPRRDVAESAGGSEQAQALRNAHRRKGTEREKRSLSVS